MIKSSGKGRFAAALAGIGVMLASTLVAAAPANATPANATPANAAAAIEAAGCTFLDYDQASGQVTGTCYGDYSGATARVTVNCNAVYPYPSWTNTRNVRVNYGLSFTYTISNCPWPASYGISAVVS